MILQSERKMYFAYKVQLENVTVETVTLTLQEAMFEMSLRKDIHEERQNQLRWQVKVGEGQMSPRDRHLVVQERSDAWEQYKVGTSNNVNNDSCDEQLFNFQDRCGNALLGYLTLDREKLRIWIHASDSNFNLWKINLLSLCVCIWDGTLKAIYSKSKNSADCAVTFTMLTHCRYCVSCNNCYLIIVLPKFNNTDWPTLYFGVGLVYYLQRRC